MSDWVRDCFQNHPQCSKRSTNARLPTRVIDVGPADKSLPPRLIRCNSQDGRFVYLSYVRGSIPNKLFPESNALAFDAELLVEELPSIIRDAIEVTRWLGIRYLWVDGFCIGQDELENREIEIATLRRNLANASIVLHVAPDRDRSEGFFTQRPGYLIRIAVTEHTRAGKLLRTDLCLRKPIGRVQESLENTALRRAWLTQDIPMPVRWMAWAVDQNHWNCDSVTRSEGNTIVEECLFPELDGSIGLDAELRMDFRKRIVFEHWYREAERYSSSQYVDYRDKYSAMSNLVKVFGPDRYLAALWEPDLRRGLLWKIRSVREVRDKGKPPPPSWSWASSEGAVSYSLLPGIREDLVRPGDCPIEVSEYEVEGSSRSGEDEAKSQYRPDYLGPPVRAVLKIKTWTRKCSSNISVDGEWREAKYHFDIGVYEEEWNTGTDYVLVFLAPWSPSYVQHGMQCIGLILGLSETHSPNPEKRDLMSYTRRGLFLGFPFSKDMPGWEQEEFYLV